MPISSIAKPTFFLGGLGAAGVVGSGVVGAHFGSSDEGAPKTADDTQIHVPQDAPKEIKKVSLAPRKRNVGFDKVKCFKGLFPNLVVAPEDRTVYDDSSQNPEGCKEVNYSKTNDGNLFVYQSEIAVRAKYVGWALWSKVSNVHSGSTGKSDSNLTFGWLRLEFRLHLLHKSNGSWYINQTKEWSIDVAEDSTSHIPTLGNLTIYKLGTQEKWLDRAVGDFKSLKKRDAQSLDADSQYVLADNWTHESYSAAWDNAPKRSPKTEVFENNSVEKVWGLTRYFGDNSNRLDQPQFPYITNLEGTWARFMPLSFKYKPFQNKTGAWVIVNQQ